MPRWASAGTKHRHVGQAPHQREVLQRVVRAAGDRERDPARRRPDHHALIGVGDLVADLLHGARGDEGRVAADEGAKPRGGEPRGHAHGVLLGDADVDDPARAHAR